jgi:hypothetical protein
MTLCARVVLVLIFGVSALVATGSAQAQASRTWVSGVGDDANPCSRTAPCKTFAGAISKTAASGVISVLDPGGYGAVTITKSITIEADGDLAGVLAAGTNGIIVNAGVNDTVVLRGIALNGFGTGINGVRFLAGGSLTLERCVIERFTQHGVDFGPSGVSTLSLRDTLIRGNATTLQTAGVFVDPGAAGSASILINNVQLVENGQGIVLNGPVNGTVRDTTVMTTNIIGSAGGHGVFADGTDSAAIDVLLDNVSIADVAVNGVFASGANAVLRLSRSTITGSAQGLLANNGGQIISYGDNRNSGNISNGAPTQTISSQ